MNNNANEELAHQSDRTLSVGILYFTSPSPFSSAFLSHVSLVDVLVSVPPFPQFVPAVPSA